MSISNNRLSNCLAFVERYSSGFRCIARSLAAIILATASIAAQAAPPSDSFDALRQKVRELRFQATPEQLATYAELVGDLTNCPPGPPRGESGVLSRYIYNAVYTWGSVITPGGFCIVLVSPVHRPLAFDEASDLLTASRMEFPVPAPKAADDPAAVEAEVTAAVLKTIERSKLEHEAVGASQDTQASQR